MRQYSPPRVDNLAPWPVKSWLLSVVSEGCQVSSKAANGRKLGVHRGLCLARVGHLRNTLKAASWKRLATHSVAEAQHICRQGFATYPLEGFHPSSCSLWQRAAKVPAARSSPATRAEATRVSHERGVNGFPLAPAKGLRSALWLRAAKVPAARSSAAARAEATRVSHGAEQTAGWWSAEFFWNSRPVSRVLLVTAKGRRPAIAFPMPADRACAPDV